ncbi:MAG: 6-bladed beta-propeller [Nitrospirae bacterium]|nr:6-bladed beta-propeller [Nitrospirota bacterium]
MRFIRPLFLFLFFAVSACAPEVHRAYIDMTASGSIIWPGKPEKPRIKYLWTLQNVGYEVKDGRMEVLDVVAGTDVGATTDRRRSKMLVMPQGLFADEKRLYVADPGASRVTVVDRQSLEVRHILEAGGDLLQYPRGIVAAAAGTIYVTDIMTKKVLAFSPSLDYLFSFEGDFLRPEGLAIDSVRGRIYVVDTDAHMVFVYDMAGKRRGTIGRRGDGDGEFYFPTYAFADAQGTLYVTDFMNFRVQVFGPDGAFLTRIGTLGDSYDAVEKPKGVAADTEGNIYVVDGAKDMVKIFNREGRLLLFFGEQGHGYGDFYLPAGIYIDNRNIIYIADSINMRIQAFQFLGGN